MRVEKMRIAVSGASGLVGTALLERLNAAGHTISRLIRPRSSSPTAGGNEPSHDLVWDPGTGLAQPDRLGQIDAIVHLAGRSIASKRWSASEKKRISDSRVAATMRMVEQIVALENPPRSFVCASAIGIYGDCGDTIVDESSPHADTFLGKVAEDWETACDPLTERGIRVVHARLGIVLSRHGGALAKTLPLFRFAVAGTLGSGKQYWSWVALEDCVRALERFVIDDSIAGALSVVSPTPVTNQEFTKAVARAVHRPAIVPTPAFLLRLVLGEMADALLLTSCRVVPRRLQEIRFEFEHPDLQTFLNQELR